MKKLKKDEFFELLCLNDSAKLKEFLMVHGKSPKPRCPVTFMNMDDIEDIDLYGSFGVISC